jgi:hypothetical protein
MRAAAVTCGPGDGATFDDVANGGAGVGAALDGAEGSNEPKYVPRRADVSSSLLIL